jgi:hypothetical protein
MKKSLLNGLRFFVIFFCVKGFAQSPVADFTISAGPVCSGSTNVVQITDISTNSPTSWSYTTTAGGPGPGTMTFAVQNPTVSFNTPGTYTITLIATNSSGASVPVSHTLQVLPSPQAQLNPQVQNTCIGGNPTTFSILTGTGSTSITYSWSTGATTASITVSPTVSTTYFCIVTGSNGCSITRSATLNITQPTISINCVPASICPGSVSTLTATGTQPGPFTYSWSNAANTRTISTNVAGVYNVTVTNGNGCTAVESYTLGTSSTLSLTATSTPSALCAGSNATLHVTGASSYTWNTGSSSANPTVNPTSSTTYTVAGMFGACSGTTTILLHVSTSPTITFVGSGSICAGNSVTLVASGATTYTWQQGGNSASVVVTPAANTIYTITGNNPGCANKTGTVSVNVMANPVISVSSTSLIICSGEVVALAANGALYYTWSNGVNGAVMILTPTVTTSYTVTGINASNCFGTAVFTQSVNACVGINELSFTSQVLELFPNPNNGNFTIKSGSALSFIIVNATGQIVKTIKTDDVKGEEIEINDLAGGIYFIMGQSAAGILKQKVVVSR